MPAFVDVRRQRLLGVHVEAVHHGAHAGQRAGVVRRGDDDRVELLAVEHLAIVLVQLPIGFFLLLRFGHAVEEAVGSGHDFARRGHLVDELIAAAAGADQADDDLLVGARRVVAPEHVGRDNRGRGERGADRGRAFQEIASSRSS